MTMTTYNPCKQFNTPTKIFWVKFLFSPFLLDLMMSIFGQMWLYNFISNIQLSNELNKHSW